MRFFGINRGPHDGGVACLDGAGELLFFSQTERVSRKKGDRSPGLLNNLLRAAGLAPIDASDLFFTTWPRWYPKFFERQVWPEDFGRKTNSRLPGFNAACQVHFLNHHHCHAAASWIFREKPGTGNSLFVTWDGGGCRADGTQAIYSAGIISRTTFKEEHFRLNPAIYSPDCRVNRIALPGTDRLQVAGKLMGLAGYVPRDKIRALDPLHPIGPLNVRLETDGWSQSNMEECASIYTSYVNDVKAHLKVLLATHPTRTVVVGGGVFLALELNTWLAEQGKQIIFGPPISDSGIALGSAAYGFFLARGKWPPPIRTPHLQWHPPDLRNHYLPPRQAARCLARNEVLGILTGKGEAGPRALGNRSLLAIPSLANARRVSMEIKGREFFRPVAPVVTEREFSRLFSGPPGRYMQFRNCGTAAARKVVPGVVHNDGTARAQVLEPDDHPWLYEVLVEVGKLTGAECLINTSLNVQGQPICNTVADFTSGFAGRNVRLVSF